MHIRLTEFDVTKIVNDYIVYTLAIFKGNFGVSSISGLSIASELKTYLPATIELVFLSMVLSFLLGIFLGMISGLKHHSFLDKFFTLSSRICTSLPVFWIGQLLMAVFAIKYKIFPTVGNIDLFCDVPRVTGSMFIDALISQDPKYIVSMLKHLVLPVVTLSLMPTAQFFLLSRRASYILSKADFINMAVSRGENVYYIAFFHMLWNIIPSILPYFSIILCNLFSACILIEVVFEWPGIGFWLIDSVQNSDSAVLETTTFVLAVMFISLQTIIDILGAIVFPHRRRISLNI